MTYSRPTQYTRPLTAAEKARNRAINVGRLKEAMKREQLSHDRAQIDNYFRTMADSRLSEIVNPGMWSDNQIANCTPQTVLDAIDREGNRRFETGNRDNASRIAILRELATAERERRNTPQRRY
jgi:hypothetical protein